VLSQVLLWTPLLAFSSSKRKTAYICSQPDGDQPEEPPQVNPWGCDRHPHRPLKMEEKVRNHKAAQS
jgi:hypothetical protein